MMTLIEWMMPAIVMTGLMLGATDESGAAFISLSPSAGLEATFLNSSTTPTYSYGTNNLQVANVLASRFGPPTSFMTFTQFKFDLSSIPASSQVTSAVLTFSLNNALYFQQTPSSTLSVTSGGSSNVQVVPPTGVSSFDNPASTSLYLSGRLPGEPATLSPQSVDETATVRAIFGTSPALAANFTIGGPSVWFYISSPTLTITFEPVAVPEPSSLALCGVAGVCGIGFWSRRRRCEKA